MSSVIEVVISPDDQLTDPRQIELADGISIAVRKFLTPETLEDVVKVVGLVLSTIAWEIDNSKETRQ